MIPPTDEAAAYGRKSPPGGPVPRMATIVTTRASPVICDPSTTATTGMRRLWMPPRKSATPQERLAASPRAMGNTDGQFAGPRLRAGPVAATRRKPSRNAQVWCRRVHDPPSEADLHAHDRIGAHGCDDGARCSRHGAGRDGRRGADEPPLRQFPEDAEAGVGARSESGPSERQLEL